MKKLLSIVCACAMLAFVGCINEEGVDSGAITLTPAQKENLTQEVGASSTEGSGITFTTASAWTSSINAVRSSEVDWVSITPDHGDEAGTYTISISLTPNETGEDRCAEIVITCGDTNITIVVKQLATDEPSQGDGNEGSSVPIGSFPGPKIKSLKQYKLADDGSLGDWMSTTTFEYNDQGLLASVTQRWGDGEYDYEKYNFTYRGTKVVLKHDQWYNNEYDGYEMIMFLNSKGYVESFYQIGYEAEVGYLEYDEDTLVKLTDADGDITEFVWDSWTMISQKKTYTDGEQYVSEYTLTPSPLYGSCFWYSQVDPLMMCQEEVDLLMPWAWGFAGGHSLGAYASISTSSVNISFDYKHSGECTVLGNSVSLISQVNTTYKFSDGLTFNECYLLEYYEQE